MKKIIKALIGSICVVLSLILALSFAGCSEKKKDGAPTSAATADEADATYPVSTGDESKAISGLEAMGFDPAALGIEPNINNDNNPVGFQLEQPKKGDTIAVIHTGMGDITLRLFPAQAPKTVTNFVNLAKAGKYNNTTFHRVINDFVIQGGHSGEDPKHPNGISSYGSEFEDEFCDKLFNIRGAVSMANSAKDSNGSQFFINQTSAEAFSSNGGWQQYNDLWNNVKKQLNNYRDSNLLQAFIDENGDKFINTAIIPDGVKSLYSKNGGNPNLDGVYNAADRGNTVFAQVISGMETVDKIAKAQVDKNNVPLDTILINSVEIKTY